MNQQVKIIGNYSYNTSHCLGEGAFGKVYQGVESNTNLKVAIKKLDFKNFERNHYLREQIETEVKILKKFNHKNIVKFIDLISTQHSLYIVTEYCSDGDLKEIMNNKRFSEQDAWNVIGQVVNGFRELVANAIIHRDLKPANILAAEGIFKIADFGLAKYVDDFNNQLMRSIVGSPLYMAPQILLRKPYTTKCDIWSLGIIFYEMVFNDAPWKGRDERDLIKNIHTQPFELKKNSISLTSRSEEFLKRSLSIEEGDRITWDKIFELFEIIPEPKFGSNKSSGKKIFQQSQPINQQHNEIAFRNFVLSIELFGKYQQLRTMINGRHINLEKLMVCLSKSNLTMQNFLIQSIQNQNSIKLAFKQELEYYQQLHNELMDLLQRNGQYSNVEKDLDIMNLQDPKQFLNDAELNKMQNLINDLIKIISNEFLKQFTLTNQANRQNLLLLDNLVDIVVIYRKMQKNAEVDYDQLNGSKAEESEIKLLLNRVQNKISKL